MDPLSIALLASGVLKYNSDVKNAGNAALRDSVYTRGGEWSNMKAQGYEQPNFWGNMMAGATGAANIEQQAAAAESNKALIDALTKNEPNFSVPSSGDFRMPDQNSGYHSNGYPTGWWR